MASKRGRGITDFGGFLGSVPINGSRYHPVIRPDVVKGNVFTRTFLSGLVQSRLSLTDIIINRGSNRTQIYIRSFIKNSINTRESIRGTAATKVAQQDEQEL